MLAQLTLVLALTALCFSYGLLFFSKFNLKTLIFGLLILKIVVLATNFFLPLQTVSVFGIWLLGLVLMALRWKKVVTNIKQISTFIKKLVKQLPIIKWLGLFGTLLFLLFAWVGSQAIPYGDAYFYHIPTVLWNQTFPLVRGMALAHYRYGFISSLFELIPVTSVLFNSHRFYFTWTLVWWSWLVTLSLYGMARLLIFLKKTPIKKLTAQQTAWLWLALTLPMSLIVARTSDYVANSMPEVGLWLATVIVGYAWLKKDGTLLLLAAVLGFAFKSSGLFLLILVLLKLKIVVKDSSKIVVLTSSFLTGLILLRSALVSGYLIFPATITQIPLNQVYNLGLEKANLVNQEIKQQTLNERSFFNIIHSVLLEAAPPSLRQFDALISSFGLIAIISGLILILQQVNLLALIFWLSTLTAWILAPSFRLSWPYFVATAVAVLLPIVKKGLRKARLKNPNKYLFGWLTLTTSIACVGIFRPRHFSFKSLLLPQPSNERAELKLQTTAQVSLPHTMAGEKDNNCRVAPAPCFTYPNPKINDPAIEELEFEFNEKGVLQGIKKREE